MIYTTILHQVREILDLTLTEYVILDSILKLQSNSNVPGYCTITKQKLADNLFMPLRTVKKTIETLYAKDLLFKDIENPRNLKVSEVFSNLVNRKTTISELNVIISNEFIPDKENEKDIKHYRELAKNLIKLDSEKRKKYEQRHGNII